MVVGPVVVTTQSSPQDLLCESFEDTLGIEEIFAVGAPPLCT